MTVLVDTSVWIGHFKQRNERLVDLLQAGLVVCHPHVVIEVACGTPPVRGSLTAVAPAQAGAHEHHERLFMKSAFSSSARCLRGSRPAPGRRVWGDRATDHVRLWSLDRRLDAVAATLGRAYRPPLPA